MYAPGTGSKWCLMNVLMNLWLAVLGLCVLLCGQGAVAMHLQSSPPPPHFPGAPPNSLTIISGGSSTSSSSKRGSDGPLLATRWTGGSPSLAAAPYNSHSGSVEEYLFNLKSSNSSSRSSGSSNISASDLDKRKHNQLDKNVLYRIWRRRRQLETLRRQRRRMQALALTPRHNQMPEHVLVHDTRPAAVRTKRDSRFGRYTPRMFQTSLVSPQPPPLSSSSQGPMHLHQKFHSPSPPLLSAVASPQLTSARERLGFDVPQHSHRQATAAALGSHQATPTTSHNSMLNKPKDQHGLPGSSTVPIPYTKPVLGSSNGGGTAHHHSAQHSVPVSPTTSHNIHQQHNSTHNHNHNHNNGEGKGPLLPLKGRKYCSARDPANLAFEAGVVFEGRVRSMSRHNYSVTFQVVKVHKTQPGFGQVPSHIRIHFKQVKSLDCDLHRENYRNPAHIRGKLEQGKVYFIFGKFVEQNNLTVIGQPMRNSDKHQREVRNGLSETYGQTASIEKLLVKGRPNRPIKLICKVNGRPPPTVSWFKGTQLIIRNRLKYKLVHRKRQSQLIIRTYDLSDSGVYECRAKNRLTKQSANATLRLDTSQYLNSASPLLPTRLPSSENRAQVPGGSDEDEPPVGAEECPPEQKERYCMNGGKCVYFSSVREFSCRCADGFGGERCDMKTPTTYNHSSMYSTHCDPNKYLGGYYC